MNNIDRRILYSGVVVGALGLIYYSMRYNRLSELNSKFTAFAQFASQAKSPDDLAVTKYVQKLDFANELGIFKEEKQLLKTNYLLKSYQMNMIDSTMTISEQWPKQSVTNKVCYSFQADQQINGQGQRQNTWTSPVGNVYVTYLFKIKPELAMFAAQLASVSVVEVIENYILWNNKNKIAQKPTMKWINDVFVGGKKICGVLPKAEVRDQDCHLWIGIGVNLNCNPIEGSTCLKTELGLTEDLDVCEFVNQLSEILMSNVQELQSKGFSLAIKPKIEHKLEFLNEKVNIYDNTLQNVLNSGVFLGVDDFGQALIQTESEIKTINEGRMRKV